MFHNERRGPQSGECQDLFRLEIKTAVLDAYRRKYAKMISNIYPSQLKMLYSVSYECDYFHGVVEDFYCYNNNNNNNKQAEANNYLGTLRDALEKHYPNERFAFRPKVLDNVLSKDKLVELILSDQ